jgi:HSP20 family protein
MEQSLLKGSRLRNHAELNSRMGKMSNIAVRNDNSRIAQTSPSREMDPFRMMRDLLRWDPFKEMAPAWPSEAPGSFNPAFEVKETKNSYLFKADLPGVKEQDIEVTVTGNRLTVSGTRNEEKVDQSDTYYSCECRYGSFSRSYTLPEGADGDHVHADLKGGVLTVAVPKKPEVQTRKVAVASTEKSVKS